MIPRFYLSRVLDEHCPTSGAFEQKLSHLHYDRIVPIRFHCGENAICNRSGAIARLSLRILVAHVDIFRVSSRKLLEPPVDFGFKMRLTIY